MIPKASAAAAKNGTMKKEAVMRNQPASCQHQLSADMRKGGEDAPADRPEAAARQVNRERQNEQAEQRAAQAHEESGREKMAEQQAAGEDAQAAHPGSRGPAVARQDDQRDDVGETRLDPARAAGSPRRSATGRSPLPRAARCGGPRASWCSRISRFARARGHWPSVTAPAMSGSGMLMVPKWRGRAR
jgi:hypothetical protein